ncbi:MAG: Rod binding protein [Firmicutes bacterium]|nr:Rod binding protein [Bacillota bacterium]
MIAGVNGASGPRKPATAPPQQDRLKEATQEFEAFFVETLLRQAREGARSLSGEQPGFARQTQEGWQDTQMARSVAQSGGLGIGEMLYRQLISK